MKHVCNTLNYVNKVRFCQVKCLNVLSRKFRRFVQGWSEVKGRQVRTCMQKFLFLSTCGNCCKRDLTWENGRSITWGDVTAHAPFAVYIYEIINTDIWSNFLLGSRFGSNSGNVYWNDIFRSHKGTVSVLNNVNKTIPSLVDVVLLPFQVKDLWREKLICTKRLSKMAESSSSDVNYI